MYYIQYIVARFFIFLLLLLPEKLRFKFGDFLGNLTYKRGNWKDCKKIF